MSTFCTAWPLGHVSINRNAPPTGPLLWECLRTDSWPFSMPTASRAALGEMATLSTGDGYFDTCVTLNASSSYTCSPRTLLSQVLCHMIRCVKQKPWGKHFYFSFKRTASLPLTQAPLTLCSHLLPSCTASRKHSRTPSLCAGRDVRTLCCRHVQENEREDIGDDDSTGYES